MAFCQGEWQHVAVHEFGDGNVHAERSGLLLKIDHPGNKESFLERGLLRLHHD